MIKQAHMVDVKKIIEDGGSVRFDWKSGRVALVHNSGHELPVDGRTYQGFLRTMAASLKCIETGSTESEDLVMEWWKK